MLSPEQCNLHEIRQSVEQLAALLAEGTSALFYHRDIGADDIVRSSWEAICLDPSTHGEAVQEEETVGLVSLAHHAQGPEE